MYPRTRGCSKSSRNESARAEAGSPSPSASGSSPPATTSSGAVTRCAEMRGHHLQWAASPSGRSSFVADRAMWPASSPRGSVSIPTGSTRHCRKSATASMCPSCRSTHLLGRDYWRQDTHWRLSCHKRVGAVLHDLHGQAVTYNAPQSHVSTGQLSRASRPHGIAMLASNTVVPILPHGFIKRIKQQ